MRVQAEGGRAAHRASAQDVASRAVPHPAEQAGRRAPTFCEGFDGWWPMSEGLKVRRRYDADSATGTANDVVWA